ncbi:hypothetical protein [Haliovirga abyssi]|uniref:DUF8042 domain-containing protein n=1 Tax=Haliovirga abyssi TaxID=2996794 RepID=A0AAU9D4V1_9FUSO|nr:hypothetical protein [Haliovirga abyssi]BDU51071.1 hypothetical protein HLVA_16400 [Haliovirga abyssi]
MEIFIDKVKVDADIEKTDDLDTIIKEVENFIKETGKVIISINIDGRALEDVDNVTINEVKKIEFETQIPQVLLLESFQEMNNYIYKLKDGIQNIVNLLAIEEESEAFTIIVQLTNGLEWIDNVFSSVKEILGIEFKKIEFDELIESFQNIVESIVESIEDRDYVLLSDILEYELLDMLEDIEKKLPILYDEILEDGKNKYMKS